MLSERTVGCSSVSSSSFSRWTDGDQWPDRFTSLDIPDGDLSLFATKRPGR